MAEEVYTNPNENATKLESLTKPKKSHKRILLPVIIIAVFAIAVYFYFSYNSTSITEDMIIAQINNITSSIGKLTNTNHSEIQVSTALDNPEKYNSTELMGYMAESEVYSLNNSLTLTKGIFEKEFSKGFNDVDSISSEAYLMILIASQGIAYTNEMDFVTRCPTNLTTNDTRDCIISILDAQKKVLPSYFSLNYDGNVESCANVLKGDNLINKKNNLGDSKSNEICQKMISYRKQLIEALSNSNLSYNEKYFILSSLYLQDSYLGNRNVSSEMKINKILIENMKDSAYFGYFADESVV